MWSLSLKIQVSQQFVVVIVWWLELQLHVLSVPIITNVQSYNPTHGEVSSMQHYTIQCVIDLMQAGGVFVGRWCFFSLSTTIKSDHHDIAELLLKVALSTRPHLSIFRITLTKTYIPYHVFLINTLLTECFIPYRVFIINILLTESYIPYRVFLIKIPLTNSYIPYHVFLIKIPLTKSLIT